MSGPVRYTPYHPKWYRRPVSVWWWLESWPYMRFVLRELTSVPVALVSLLTLWQVHAPLARSRLSWEVVASHRNKPFLFLSYREVFLL